MNGSTTTIDAMDVDRHEREGSFHPMASDSESGSVSDGDPPGYDGRPPPPPIAPRPVLPKRESSSRSVEPPQQQRDITIGMDVLSPGAQSDSSSGSGSGSKTRTRRSFDELEDVMFSHPRTFLSMALRIAESRDAQVLISDDRTGKANSAYMHLVCPYRRAGCPLHIRLTRAKEGGWIVKGPGMHDTAADQKQRSVYRCRHPSAGYPDFTVGQSVQSWLDADARRVGGTSMLPPVVEHAASTSTTATATVPMSLMMSGSWSGSGESTTNGTAPTAATTTVPTSKPPSSTDPSPRRSLRSSDPAASTTSDSLKQVDPSSGKAARFPRSAHKTGPLTQRPAQAKSTSGSPASAAIKTTPRVTPSPAGSAPTSGGGGSLSASVASRIDPDRALAPPFQRALDLQAQIAPALGHGGVYSHHRAPLTYANGGPRQATESPITHRPAAAASKANPYPPLTSAAMVAPATPPVSTKGNGDHHQPYYFAPPPGATVMSTAAPFAAPVIVRADTPVSATIAPVAAAAVTPCVAVTDPSATAEWTAFLTRLGEPDLVPLAKVLGSAAISVTPAAFFSDEADDDLRASLLDQLPASAVGLWPKLKLAKRIRERGEAIWREMQLK